MKIRINLDPLWEAVKKMGADKEDFVLGSLMADGGFEFDDELSSSGIEIDLSEVDTDHGLLSYKGRQILLYIPDHGNRVEEALQDGALGKKFHVSDCSTLEQMRNAGRYERYIVTNNISGDFYIHGISGIDGETRLNVCQNCLKKLNYKAFCSLSWPAKKVIVNDFDMEEFFSTYSSIFRYLPKFNNGLKNGYTEDWNNISSQVKEKAGYKCQHCYLDLSFDKKLLHGHHKNGVKNDNRIENLIALCADCHRKEPYHEHMFVKRGDIEKINTLRREQGLMHEMQGDWLKVYQFADSALHGVLNHCQINGYPTPEIGYAVNTIDGDRVILDIAWPNFYIDNQSLGVCLGRKVTITDWEIYDLDQALEYFSE